MDFRIADTFLDSLARLTGDEQKLVKTTVFDLQVNPANPGHQLHKLDRARDRNFWSVRVGSDIRLIVHRTPTSLLVCYVNHHDKAYAWAERRRMEVHPKTGAAQLVEIRETVREIVIPRPIEAPTQHPPARRLFEDVSRESLLSFGVPQEWIEDVRAADEDGFFRLADHLPAEAAQALLEIATGGAVPAPPIAARAPSIDHAAVRLSQEPVGVDADSVLASAMEHPDAQRRFRLVHDTAELERALDAPWDRWTVFLHPDQREIVEREQTGPVRVSGSAGTGKTIVALHRAVHLARTHPEARVLLATFDEPLANALAMRLRRLVGNEPRLADRIDVASLDAAGARLYRSVTGKTLRLVSRQALLELLQDAAASVPDLRISRPLIVSEWDHVVDACAVSSWDEYRDVPRLGRRTRLREERRRQLWSVYEKVLEALRNRGEITQAMMFTALARELIGRRNPPYDFAVVDEAQDLSMAQLRFLAALGVGRPDALFFAGDMGQRIFQQPFSWKATGVDVRGRSRTLHVNYRTSHQIRMQADRLLGPETTDADGVVDTRNRTISLFNGPEPQVVSNKTGEEEITKVADWLAERSREGIAAHEMGLFVRSRAQLARAMGAADKAGIPYKILDDVALAPSGYASVGTMHLAKGLEFKAVAVMACDDDVIPLQERIEAVGEDGDLQETYDSERQLLYVACTRARDVLLVTGVEPVSEFLDDIDKRADEGR
jgi:superfamily I DNA/RNA helicase/mRNA-degrading endonuclease RelE of RelBE toxin-antitoxin system